MVAAFLVKRPAGSLLVYLNPSDPSDTIDTGCRMHDIEYFDILIGCPVDNQMGREDDVSVHSALGGGVAAFGVIWIGSV